MGSNAAENGKEEMINTLVDRGREEEELSWAKGDDVISEQSNKSFMKTQNVQLELSS
jgi:hypothetical protein